MYSLISSSTEQYFTFSLSHYLCRSKRKRQTIPCYCVANSSSRKDATLLLLMQLNEQRGQTQKLSLCTNFMIELTTGQGTTLYRMSYTTAQEMPYTAPCNKLWWPWLRLHSMPSTLNFMMGLTPA